MKRESQQRGPFHTHTALVCLLIGTGYAAGVHGAELHPLSTLEIEHSGDSWTCSGVAPDGDRTYDTIFFGLDFSSSLSNRPVVMRESLFVLERICDWEYPMSFYRHQHCLTQLAVASGNVLSSTYLTVYTNAEHPVQVWRILPWKGHILVDGFFQEPYVITHKPIFQLFDRQGELVNVLFDDLFWDIAAVDETQDLLICTQEYEGRDSEGHPIAVNPTFRVLELPSFNLRATHPRDSHIPPDMVVGPNGYLYCLHTTTGALVKYSIEPWQELWTKRIEPESDAGYPRLLRFHEGLLWYAMYDRDYQWVNDSSEEYRWIEKPLDPETGEPVDTDKTFDPYRRVVNVEGQPYAITWQFGSFRVEPVGSPVGKWEGYR